MFFAENVPQGIITSQGVPGTGGLLPGRGVAWSMEDAWSGGGGVENPL